MERTYAMIKPDAVEKGAVGPILTAITEAGLKVVALKMTRLTKAQAEGFYGVHRERPFFAELTTWMASGPVVAMILEGEGAIARWRELMGPTDATKAPKDTIRGRFGTSIQTNAVHGSDALETAAFEMSFLFSGAELAALEG
ncbi:MAG: nucleoside-diphosphate kinase [Polyangia bacterium]|jgi:nucleoside-diphosphate kinase|nr:nucleoside-diphosphate kinase [Polyangia bacterium]